MNEHRLDAIVARAPDNVLYLTNYWCMKGYDAVVFPRQGDPTLIVIEPQLGDAHRAAWTRDIRPFKFYDERDPRPPTARSLDLALKVLRERGADRARRNRADERLAGRRPHGWRADRVHAAVFRRLPCRLPRSRRCHAGAD
jgi:Xaa-Pro aminopeptidase